MFNCYFEGIWEMMYFFPALQSALSEFYLSISTDSSFLKLHYLSTDARGGHTMQNKLKYGNIPSSYGWAAMMKSDLCSIPCSSQIMEP